MPITPHRVPTESDKRRMAQVVRAHPSDHLHVVDLPYRFASWALEDPANTALWEDARGRLVAWATLQFPFWCIDYAWLPDALPDTHAAILPWADSRAAESGRPCWFVNVLRRQHQRRHALERAGFTDQAGAGDAAWSKVLLRSEGRCGDGTALASNTFAAPSGFHVRPLKGTAEVAGYVALHQAVFESKNMTESWRLRTLDTPEYRPELDLVAVAPDGRLAGFAVGWLADRGPDGRPAGQFEPVGVHPDFQRRGLGRALITEGLRRLFDAGAASVSVETDNQRGAALGLYTAAGFQVVEEVRVYRKDFKMS